MQNKAKKLIEMIQTAPVEWKPLGEVLVRTKGTKITAGQMKEMHKDNAPLKIFAGGKTFALVDFDDVPDKDIHREPSIIVKSRGIIEFEYYDKPFSHKNEMWSYHSVNKNNYIKYIYYFLKTQENHFRNIGSKMQMPQIAIPDTDNYKIPIPPIETQQKIVKILDKFTELEATLEAELQLRKQQYNYYRDYLLTFDESGKQSLTDRLNGLPEKVVWKRLGEIFDISAGGDAPKDAFSEVETEEFCIPILSNGIGSKALYGWTNVAKINQPSLTISARGTIGWTSFQDRPFFPIVRLLALTPKIEINVKYAYYFMKTIESDYKIPESGIPQLTKPMIKDIEIPIPPLAEQARIVAILDKFDTLTTSLSEGLPREIAMRCQQYEYYREQLLKFPIPMQ